MSEFITKIRTSEGDKQIDYNALGNKPQFKMPATGDDGVVLTDKTTGYEAQKTDGEHIGTLIINNEEHKLYTSKTFTLETDVENNKTYKPVLSGDDGWKYVVSSDNKDVMCVGDGNGNVGGLRLSSALEGHGDLYQADTAEDVVHYLPATGGTLLNDKSIIGIENGGFGATTVEGALENLGLTGIATGITTDGTGEAYTATVPGITELVAGASFIMIPHVTSNSTFATLDVNDLGAQYIRRRTSDYSHGGVALPKATYLQQGYPTRVIYNGTYWIVEDTVCPAKSDYIDILLNTIYPVGSIYMSVNNVSPQTFLGGTWEQIKDTFLLSAGDTYAAGSTGGKATHSQVYEGIAYEIRKDKCVYTKNTKKENLFAETETETGNNWISTAKYSTAYGDYASNTTEVSQTGLSTQTKVAMDIMPPYLTVYMWQRIS